MGSHLGLPFEGFQGKAQAITWKTLQKSPPNPYPSMESARKDALFPTNGITIIINFGRFETKKNKGKCSDFSLKLELLFIWAIFVYEMRAEICVLGESHTVDKYKGILPQLCHELYVV